MALNAKKVKGGNKSSGPTTPHVEPGTYKSRLVQVIDFGVQEQRPYQGQEKPPAPEVYTTYELVDEFMLKEDGTEDESRPRWISERFALRNLSSDLAKSTKRYKALDPSEEFEGDWTQLVGVPCMVTIVANQGKGKNADKVFNNISNVSPMRAKDAKTLPELVNSPKVLDLDDPDLEVFGSLPEWMQNIIKEGLEFEDTALYQALNGGKSKPKKSEEATEQGPPFDTEEDGDDW